MAGSVNKVILIGNLGQDPDIKTMQSGDKVCNLSIATNESWKDKATGERKERTEWHRVVIFAQGIVKIAEQYLRKGDKVYIEGQLETRSWEQDGQKKYTTEVVLRPYRSSLNMLQSKGSGGPPPNENADPYGQSQGGGYYDSSRQVPPENTGGDYPIDEMEDEIPFAFILPLVSSLLTIGMSSGILLA